MQFEFITKKILGTFYTNYIFYIEKDLKTGLKLYINFNVYHFNFFAIKHALGLQHLGVRAKARNQDSVSEWSDMSNRGL